LLAAFFALLNGQKVKALRADAATPRASVPAKVNASNGWNKWSATTGQKPLTHAIEPQKPEAALAQRKEKADLEGKLDASQQEIAALRQRAAGMQTNSNPSAPAPRAS
jgi:hypothetical protein